MSLIDTASNGGVVPLQYSSKFNEINHLNATNIHSQGLLGQVYNFAKSWFKRLIILYQHAIQQ